MFSAVIRVAGGWSAGMLVIAALSEVVNPYVLPRLQDGGLLHRSLSGIVLWLPVLLTIAALLKLVARGLAERGVA